MLFIALVWSQDTERTVNNSNMYRHTQIARWGSSAAHTSCTEESRGFPSSSAGKESACNAGNPSLIPGSGRSPGEGILYPLQNSRASLAAQMVKNPPVIQETWVRSLGREDPLEEGMATHSSHPAWRIPWTEELGGLQSMELQSQTQLSD